jgi:hypothetical protein
MRLRRTISPAQPSLALPAEFPTGTGTGALAASTGGVNLNAVCPGGAMGDYVGMIRGREAFQPALAWSFTNGPCGRLSVNPVPLDVPSNVTGPAVGPGTPDLPVETPFKRAVKLLSG